MIAVSLYRARTLVIRVTAVMAVLLAIAVGGALNALRTMPIPRDSDAGTHGAPRAKLPGTQTVTTADGVTTITTANGVTTFSRTLGDGRKKSVTSRVVQTSGSQINAASLARFLETGGFVGLIVASVLAANLSRERLTLALAWTRPRSRYREALAGIGIDVATIVMVDFLALGLLLLAYALFLLLANVLGFGWIFGTGGLRFSMDGLGDLGLFARVIGGCLGASIMWYGIVAACTASFARPALAWVAWPVFLVLAALAASHGLRGLGLDSLVAALALFDPILYFNANSDIANRILTSWAIGATGVAIAVVGWSRREFSR